MRSRNGQPLVAVALRDRDDEAQVRLDHRLLREVVAALDLFASSISCGAVSRSTLPMSLQEELERCRSRIVRRVEVERLVSGFPPPRSGRTSV
jgi:hypothetical protein